MPLAKQANINKYADKLRGAMITYRINTPNRIAMFLAQLAHESSSLSHTSENLNYSEQGLLKTFGKYFKKMMVGERRDLGKANVAEYAHKPEKIANRVYANRMGNGNEESGDGWKYRGRGPIMNTGKNQYELLSKELNYDFVKDPDALALPGAGSYSACWFWNSHGLNEIADKNSIDGFRLITKRINGGNNGIAERINNWLKCRKALGV